MTGPERARLTVRVWGARGSVPAPGPATVRHGGNTSCVEIVSGDRSLVLDAGTGVRALGAARRAAGATGPVDVLLTHAHSDHVHGLPFFAPLFDRDAVVTLYTPAGLDEVIAGAARTLLRPPLFPAPVVDADPTRVRFATLPPAGETVEIAGFRVRAIEAAHPGGAVGFRVDDGAGEAVVYLPDNELGAVEGVCGGRRAMLEAIADAALLLHDSTYLPAELPQHRGWGHSTYAEAVRLAADAGVARLVLFHHHPDRSDDDVVRLTTVARALGEASTRRVEVVAAYEGMEISL